VLIRTLLEDILYNKSDSDNAKNDRNSVSVITVENGIMWQCWENEPASRPSIVTVKVNFMNF
jgi:hypothetical protein